MKEKLTIDKLKAEAKAFCIAESKIQNKSLFGVTDGKAVGTHKSSCPFKDAKQKIFGLGYNLLVFVYDKTDDPKTKTANLDFVSCSFISKERTADYTTTYRLREMVKDKANVEDIVAYLSDKNIPEYQRVVRLDETVQGISKLIDKVAK